MTDETIEGLRKAYMKHKDDTPDECSKAGRISEYAFGELGMKKPIALRST